ncbi:MAG: helix-turn-helix domain-containing protein [Paludibacteraceae bacterium]|nr:helix-turn-helix domain-containing protein [Paludibacteraceae bacterium]
MNERERIERLIATLKLSARQFAEQIHVQPGTISNMMSGRNNPSLDVMKRIMQRYPTLNPEWLIVGKGEMWRTVPGQEAGLFDVLPPDPKEETTRIIDRQPSYKQEEPQVIAAPQKQIRNIVIYYTDGTYEEFSKA